MTREEENALNTRLLQQGNLLHDAYSAFWQVQSERDTAQRELTVMTVKYGKTQENQYRERFLLGAGSVAAIFATIGIATSYFNAPKAAIDTFATGAGGFVLLLIGLGATATCVISGISKWKEPEP